MIVRMVRVLAMRLVFVRLVLMPLMIMMGRIVGMPGVVRLGLAGIGAFVLMHLAFIGLGRL